MTALRYAGLGMLVHSTGLADLGQQLAVKGDACAAIIVQTIAVAPLLIGIQVHAPRLSARVPNQVQPLVQLPKLRDPGEDIRPPLKASCGMQDTGRAGAAGLFRLSSRQ